MIRESRFPWSKASAGPDAVPVALMVAILAMVPMVALGYPWLGVAALAAALGWSSLQLWMYVRLAREQQRELVSYAQYVTNLGGDPSLVIAALSGGREVPDSVTAWHRPDATPVVPTTVGRSPSA